jgi:hypothetical protein
MFIYLLLYNKTDHSIQPSSDRNTGTQLEKYAMKDGRDFSFTISMTKYTS